MLFNDVKSVRFESKLLTPQEDAFSVQEVGKISFDHVEVQLKPHQKPHGKYQLLMLYMRDGHAIVRSGKSQRVVLTNELVMVPLVHGVNISYAEGNGDFWVAVNCPQSEFNRNPLRSPAEIDPKQIDGLLEELMRNDDEPLTRKLKSLNVVNVRDVKQRDLVRQAIVYIDERLAQRVSLDDVSSSVDYSKFHFIRLFDEYVGMTPHQYVCQRRLYMARDLLDNTSMSIADVALRSGIRFTSNFYNHFKRKFGVTPKEYRQRTE